MKIFEAKDQSVIVLNAADTDLLIIEFYNSKEETTAYSKIRLRGAESDAVIKKLKNKRL